MAAIVRVKRRLDEDPAESLVFVCKRIKVEQQANCDSTENSESVKSEFKFAGTTEKKDCLGADTVRQAIRKEKLEKEYKQHVVNISAATAIQHKISTVNARKLYNSMKGGSFRYKVVSNRRALDIDSLVNSDSTSNSIPATTPDVETADSKIFSLFDVERIDSELPPDEDIDTPNISEKIDDVVTCNGVPMIREKLPGDEKYVYDLYYLNNACFDHRALENILAIEALREETVFLPDEEKEDDVLEDEDDENDENNWRNDYPEEESSDEENGGYRDEDEDYGCYGGDDDFEDDFERQLNLW